MHRKRILVTGTAVFCILAMLVTACGGKSAEGSASESVTESAEESADESVTESAEESVGESVTESAAGGAGESAAGSGRAPESIRFAGTERLLLASGETYDVASVLEIEGEGADTEMIYSTFDESIAEISGEGIVTAGGYGVTTIVVSSAVDETVSASVDVTVFDLYGTYSGMNRIEAMDCDISIDITLKEDGTFSYYRAPMNVQMNGGGEMPELEDQGTYERNGTDFVLKGDELGEFTVTFTLEGETGSLAGKLPTGGAATDMKLVKAAGEE